VFSALALSIHDSKLPMIKHKTIKSHTDCFNLNMFLPLAAMIFNIPGTKEAQQDLHFNLPRRVIYPSQAYAFSLLSFRFW